MAPVNAPFSVSKQFALEQTSRDCRAVELHESVVLTPTVIVNGACDQFLPGSGLAK